MSVFKQQFDEVKELLLFRELPQVTKRIIDFTLDTENLDFYRKTNIFLDWLDTHESRVEEVAQKQQALLEELYKYLISKPLTPLQTVITTVHLEKRYGMGFCLGPIDLSIKSGEIIGLVGENGNGKTTLLRLLCGELLPTNGTVKYDFGYSDLYDLRSKLIYIPQRTEVWRGSMFENLAFTASCYGYKPEEIELLVNLVVTRMGLRKFRMYNWSGLSSGYKMRFELARMLLRKPKILLIDEPLANLDILAQQTVLEDFKQIARSPFRPLAIVLSSQQLYEVEKNSAQVLFLKQGKQKHLVQSNVTSVNKPFVIELESEWGMSQLSGVLKPLGMETIEQNGGTYIITFLERVTMKTFLNSVLEHNIPLVYLRDISQSTRRFFVK